VEKEFEMTAKTFNENGALYPTKDGDKNIFSVYFVRIYFN